MYKYRDTRNDTERKLKESVFVVGLHNIRET